MNNLLLAIRKMIINVIINTINVRGFDARLDIKSMSRGIVLAPNRCNSVPCTFRTSRQRSCNQRVGCPQNWDLEHQDMLIGLALGCYQPCPEVYYYYLTMYLIKKTIINAFIILILFLLFFL